MSERHQGVPPISTLYKLYSMSVSTRYREADDKLVVPSCDTRLEVKKLEVAHAFFDTVDPIILKRHLKAGFELLEWHQ